MMTESPGVVTHGYLTHGGPRPVFASYHAPRGPARDIRWLLCAPHGWEGIQSYETVKLLADELATAGFHVLRIHYDGTGESFGTDEDLDRVAAWLESIRRAAEAFAPKDAKLGLVGLRIGATLAGEAARTLDVARLVLWEPCVAGAHYTREMEILASASPRAVRDGEAAAALGVEAGGYLLTPETVASLNAIDLTKTLEPKAPTLVLCRDDRPPLFAKKLAERLGTSVVQLPGFKELMTYPEKAKPGREMVARIRDWAVEQSATSRDDVAVPLSATASHDRTQRRVVRFGPDARLFGVLTEPSGVQSAHKRPVVLLTGGVVPRISVNRMYVVLATRLAEMGHRVLRLDVSGICESPPAPGAAPNDPHAASLLDDVKAAVALMLEGAPTKEIALLGLCSGAYASFQTALSDERVKNIVLLNPEVFHLKDGTPAFSETEQSHAASHYRRSLMSPAAWKKLLTGKANVGYITGFVKAKAASTLAKAKERVEARITKAPQGLAGDIHRLLGRGVKIAIVMAKDDSGYAALMSQLGPDLERLGREGLRYKETPGPDHTFNDFSTRLPLIEWLVEVLAS